MEYDKKMDNPSNGLSILGCLRPTFSDEESYLRKLFQSEDADNHNLDWKGMVQQQNQCYGPTHYFLLANNLNFLYVITFFQSSKIIPWVLS